LAAQPSLKLFDLGVLRGELIVLALELDDELAKLTSNAVTGRLLR
jgi:hypothetical protein